MNITIKITHSNGTVTDISIPIATEPTAPLDRVDTDSVVPPKDDNAAAEPVINGEPEAQKEDVVCHGPDVLEALKEELMNEPEDSQNTGTTFSCTDGIYFIPHNLYADFCAAFGQPTVDQQLRLASLWCQTNPQKRKTRRGMGRFLNAWLCRAQGEKRVALNSRGSLLDAAPSAQEGW